jgi:hypothetical protein
MPKLTATVGSKKFRLHRFKDGDDRSYGIQEQSATNKKVWNTVDTFGIVYYGSPRPFGYLGMSFATAGLAFDEFIKRETKSQANQGANQHEEARTNTPESSSSTA